MRAVIIVEARLSSRRLPGKALSDLAGVPMLGRLLQRLARCRQADAVCLATSDRPEDAALEAVARVAGALCYRGALDDVLGRVRGAADWAGADIVVEITGDCPLVDPALIDQAVARFRAGGADYVANMLGRLTYPIGMDVQVYSRALLGALDLWCDDPDARQDVTPWVYRHGGPFRLLNLVAPPALDRPRYRLCVDHAADLALVRALWAALTPANPDFGLAEIVAFLDKHPDLAASNISGDDAFACPQPVGPVCEETMLLPAEDPRLRAA